MIWLSLYVCVLLYSYANKLAVQHQQWSHYNKRQSTEEDGLLCVCVH